MSVQLTSDVTQIRAERCSNGGWVVFRVEGPIYRITESSPMAACSDDEALLEWLASQFGLPAPEIERPARTFPGMVQLGQDQTAKLSEALQPFRDLADRLRGAAPEESLFVEAGENPAPITISQLMALARAAEILDEELPF